MDLDASLGRWCRGKSIAIGRPIAAIVDGHAVGIHIAGLEGSGPGVNGEFTGYASIDRSRSLNLGARLAGHHQEVEAGALEVDVAGIVMELHVPGGGGGVGQILEIEAESDRPRSRRVG